jgi:transposase
MNEQLRNEIIMLHSGGASMRRIAKMLRISRKTVKRVLAEHDQARRLGAAHPDLPRPRKRRASLLDPYEDFMGETLERYPDITVVRLLEELQARGFTGKYSIVRARVEELRPPRRRKPVVRFETAAGRQAQMDYSPYILEFHREGRRKVHCFSYILAHSRRQYIRFVESEDFVTTIREHVRAFEYLDGLARVCLYDNMKVVVSGFDGDEPIYNTRFLAFCTHYDFRPWSHKPRRSQTKGKVERPFDFIEKNLLNARDFESLEHLNRFTAWWLRNRADVRIHRETKRRPIDLYYEEKCHLLPLPDHAYDTAEVVYRVVDVEGCISYRNNSYSVPWQFIGELLPVRVTDTELFVYGKDIQKCAQHELFEKTESGQRRILREHRPRSQEGLCREVLKKRFESLSPAFGVAFFEGLLERRRCGKHEASRILGLLELYQKVDLVGAIERAQRYGAWSFSAVERILAIHAEPRSTIEALADEGREHLRDLFDRDRVEPRKTSEYQHLLDEDPSDGQKEEP